MPLKFLSVKQDEDVFKRILSLGKHGQTRKGNRNAVPVHSLDKQFLWSKKQIKSTEKLFDDVFEIFFSEKFLDVVYPPEKSSLDHEEFAKRFWTGKSYIGHNEFANDTGEIESVGWIFSPSRVSSVFSQLLKSV